MHRDAPANRLPCFLLHALECFPCTPQPLLTPFSARRVVSLRNPRRRLSQHKSLRIGEKLQDGLLRLQGKHEIIGDSRGCGGPAPA